MAHLILAGLVGGSDSVRCLYGPNCLYVFELHRDPRCFADSKSTLNTRWFRLRRWFMHVLFLTVKVLVSCFCVALWFLLLELCLVPCSYVFSHIWAPSRENLFSGFATRYDSTQPAQLHRLARVLKFRL